MATLCAPAAPRHPTGNGSDEALQSRGAAGPLGPVRQAVCAKWLAPILTAQYPKFSAWMLVGERVFVVCKCACIYVCVSVCVYECVCAVACFLACAMPVV